DVFALRIIAARGELAKAAVLHHELGLAAFRTGLVQNNVRLLRRLWALRDFARGLAFRIARARQELTEPAALQRHRLAPVLARLGFFRRGALAFFRRFFRRQFLRVLAFGICGAGEETSELAPLLDHRTAALLANLVGRNFLRLEVLHVLRGLLQVLRELLVELI